MTLAESTIMNAVKYSISKFDFANIIIAGPLFSGKKRIVNTISDFLTFAYSFPEIEFFLEEDYYKDYNLLNDTPFNVKNIDEKKSFDTQRLNEDLEKFTNGERIFIRKAFMPKYKLLYNPNDNLVQNETILRKFRKKINFFVGPHMIELTTPYLSIVRGHGSFEELSREKLDKIHNDFGSDRLIKEPIKIYINAENETCMKHRASVYPFFYNSIGNKTFYGEYSDFINSQNKEEVLIQKDMADIVINN